MSNLLIRVELPVDTNLAADTIVNTFAVRTTADLDEALATAVAADIAEFYNTAAPTGALAVRDYLAPTMTDGVNVPVKFYDITGHEDGTEPVGSPVLTWGFGLGNNRTGGVSSLPGEVAACLTLEAGGRSTAPVEAPDGADPGGAVDRPRERLTGRIYLGMLASNCTAIVGGATRLSAAFRDDVTKAAVKLNADLFDDFVTWCVWSRQNADFQALEAVSMDDAFDTMRSRGVKATTRTRLAA